MILKDIGYQIPFPAIISIMAPKGLPEGIARRLEEAFASAMKEPGFIDGMKRLNFHIVHRSGKQLNDYVVRNYRIYEELVKEIARP
jgi:tripartite-type tricarboxylate transporter receptor subunit TctC